MHFYGWQKLPFFVAGLYPSSSHAARRHIYIYVYLFSPRGIFEFALCKGELKRAAVVGVRVAPSLSVVAERTERAPPPPPPPHVSGNVAADA